jgi:hypothetical protein
MNMRRAGVGLISLLLLANGWKWWPAVDAHLHGQDIPGKRLFTVEDFQVHGLTVEFPSKSGRDLFHLGQGGRDANENSFGLDRGNVADARSGQIYRANAVFKKSSAAVLTSQQVAEESSRNQIGQIKCIGVMFQENKKPEAYMVRGEQRYIMRRGDVMDGQFEVEKITIEAVYFKDLRTGVTGSVPVNGNEGIINK